MELFFKTVSFNPQTKQPKKPEHKTPTPRCKSPTLYPRSSDQLHEDERYMGSEDKPPCFQTVAFFIEIIPFVSQSLRICGKIVLTRTVLMKNKQILGYNMLILKSLPHPTVRSKKFTSRVVGGALNTPLIHML